MFSRASSSTLSDNTALNFRPWHTSIATAEPPVLEPDAAISRLASKNTSSRAEAT